MPQIPCNDSFTQTKSLVNGRARAFTDKSFARLTSQLWQGCRPRIYNWRKVIKCSNCFVSQCFVNKACRKSACRAWLHSWTSIISFKELERPLEIWMVFLYTIHIYIYIYSPPLNCLKKQGINCLFFSF